MSVFGSVPFLLTNVEGGEDPLRKPRKMILPVAIVHFHVSEWECNIGENPTAFGSLDHPGVLGHPVW